MKYVPLSQGLYAIVSDRDYGYLNHWAWTAWCCGNVRYAYRKTSALAYDIAATRLHGSFARLNFARGN